MLATIAFIVLLAYVWRTRRDLETTIRALTRRIEALELEQIAHTQRVAKDAAPRAIADEPGVGSPPQRASDVAMPAGTPERAPYVPVVASRPIPPPPLPMTDVAATGAGDPTSLEAEIGSRWLLYVGVVALIVGASYFQKLAIDYGWIGERARVIEGLAAGALLIAGGRWCMHRGYDLYGQIVVGGGVAVLYVAVYAAATLYELIARPVAFVVFSAVTVLAAWLADRYRSQGLAVMAVGGGFMTPFLLPSDRDAQVALFTYDGVLIAGTMYLAHRRVWPLLNGVSYVLTALTVFAWAAVFYERSKYLVTEAYLTAFCAMFLYILYQMRRSRSADAEIAKAALWTAPIVYYAGSLLILYPHPIAFLVFLGIVATIGAGLAPFGHQVIRFGVWLAVAAPLVVWVNAHPGPEWFVPGITALTGIYLVNLLAQVHGMTADRSLAEPDIALLHLNPLVLYSGAHWLVGSVYPSATPDLAFGFACWNGLLALVLRERLGQYALHFGAVAATLLAVAIGLQFEGEARTIGWSAEGVAVVWLGLRQQRRWLHIGGLAVFGMAVLQLLLVLPLRPSADYTVVLNWRALCGVFVVTMTYLLAWLHRPLMVGSWRAATPFVIAANVLTLALMTSEITAYWRVRELIEPAAAGRLARELMLSVTWALYATALIVIGLSRDYAPIRYLAMGLFGLTILKVFFFDLEELDQIYRVLSIVALGVLLLVSSYLYNRARAGREGSHPPAG